METDSEGVDPRAPAAPAEATPGVRRRVALSIFIVVTLVAIATNVMPASVLRDQLLQATQPYLLATGLDQGWGVFAPNPPQESTSLVARVERVDGTSADYAPPHGRGLAAYWDYRWLKVGDRVMEEQDATQLRTAFAAWAAGEDRRTGARPVRVTLLRTTVPVLGPGGGPESGRPHQESVYELTVGPR